MFYKRILARNDDYNCLIGISWEFFNIQASNTGKVLPVNPTNHEETFGGVSAEVSEERGVFGVRSIPVAILPSRQDMKTIAL